MFGRMLSKAIYYPDSNVSTLYKTNTYNAILQDWCVFMNGQWTKDDSQTAVQMGWNLFEIYDLDKRRIFWEIQRTDDSHNFPSDEAARAYVKGMASNVGSIFNKAAGIMFRSKSGLG